MSAQITANPEQTITQLLISSREVLPQILPTMTLGDIVRLTVRQNDKGGMGSIYFKGHLITAELPEYLSAGDKLLAQITGNNEQLIFKILEHKSTQKSSGEISPTEIDSSKALANTSPIVRELMQMLTDTTGMANRNGDPLPIPESLGRIISDTQSLTKLFSLLKSEDLTQAQNAMSQLVSAAEGSLTPQLKELVSALQKFVEINAPTPDERISLALRSELMEIMDQVKSKPNQARPERRLENIIDALTDYLSTRDGKEGETSQSLRSTLADIVAAHRMPKEMERHLERATAKLERHAGALASQGHKLDPKSSEELKRVATKLEQMVAAQESINQLNPLMQAMGEPALILFPFLFQGLLSHSQITIESRNKGGGGQHSKKRGRNRSDTESHSYHRIQVSVPLPSMGTVDVDIAHEGPNILVCLTVEDSEVASFLMEQLEKLGSQLRERGFEKAELVTRIGTKDSKRDAWSFGMHAGTAFIA